MWSPVIAHLYHLKRADMLDHTLHEVLSMYESSKA